MVEQVSFPMTAPLYSRNRPLRPSYQGVPSHQEVPSPLPSRLRVRQNASLIPLNVFGRLTVPDQTRVTSVTNDVNLDYDVKMDRIKDIVFGSKQDQSPNR